MIDTSLHWINSNNSSTLHSIDFQNADINNIDKFIENKTQIMTLKYSIKKFDYISTTDGLAILDTNNNLYVAYTYAEFISEEIEYINENVRLLYNNVIDFNFGNNGQSLMLVKYIKD